MNKFYPLDKGFGWYKMPDERDKDFPVESVIKEVKEDRALIYKYWKNNVWWGDQGPHPYCVGYSWAHWIEDGPLTLKGAAPVLDPIEIYSEAQKLDEWLGEGYEGTSVRGGAKYLVEKGYIEEYRWAWDLETMIDAILYVGSVIVGSYWYTDMMYPDKNRFLHVGGIIEGGHAYKVDGVSRRYKQFRIKNSWGRGWGDKGLAFISFDDMRQLVEVDGGDVCIAIPKQE